MSKTTEEWRKVYAERNARRAERRKTLSKGDRKFYREMGRALSLKKWDKNSNSVVGEY